MHQVTFPTLSPELIDFLKRRVKKKECPFHSKKATIKVKGDNTIVSDICCERFAKIIGQAPQIHLIKETASKIRGLILNDFATTETFLDVIIELSNQKYPLRFSNKLEPAEIEFLSMRERKLLLKIALEIYSEETKTNIDQLWGQFCNLIKIRNCMAHWPIDTDETALKLMEESSKIRFIKVKNGNPIESEVFNIDRANKIVNAVSKLTTDIIQPYYFFRDK